MNPRVFQHCLSHFAVILMTARLSGVCREEELVEFRTIERFEAIRFPKQALFLHVLHGGSVDRFDEWDLAVALGRLRHFFDVVAGFTDHVWAG